MEVRLVMAADLSAIVESGDPVLIAAGGPTEGPLWHPDDYLTYVRHRESMLMRWDGGGEPVVVRTDTGEGNGCTLDRQGGLLMCEGANRQITRMDADGTVTTVADRWQGKRLNRPNDIVCRSDGSVYSRTRNGAFQRNSGNWVSPASFGLRPMARCT